MWAWSGEGPLTLEHTHDLHTVLHTCTRTQTQIQRHTCTCTHVHTHTDTHAQTHSTDCSLHRSRMLPFKTHSPLCSRNSKAPPMEQQDAYAEDDESEALEAMGLPVSFGRKVRDACLLCAAISFPAVLHPQAWLPAADECITRASLLVAPQNKDAPRKGRNKKGEQQQTHAFNRFFV